MITVGKPHLVIDAAETAMANAEDVVRKSVGQHLIKKLNVAGPRGSKESSGYESRVSSWGD